MMAQNHTGTRSTRNSEPNKQARDRTAVKLKSQFRVQAQAQAHHTSADEFRNRHLPLGGLSVLRQVKKGSLEQHWSQAERIPAVEARSYCLFPLPVPSAHIFRQLLFCVLRILHTFCTTHWCDHPRPFSTSHVIFLRSDFVPFLDGDYKSCLQLRKTPTLVFHAFMFAFFSTQCTHKLTMFFFFAFVTFEVFPSCPSVKLLSTRFVFK